MQPFHLAAMIELNDSWQNAMIGLVAFVSEADCFRPTIVLAARSNRGAF